jgi:hypothetical protein
MVEGTRTIVHDLNSGANSLEIVWFDLHRHEVYIHRNEERAKK